MANAKLTCWAELWTQDLYRSLGRRVNAGYINDDPEYHVASQIAVRFLEFDKLDEVYLCEPLKYHESAYLLYRYNDKITQEENLEVLLREIKKRYARIFEAWKGTGTHKKFQLVMVQKHPDHISTYDTGLDKVNTDNMYLVAPADATVYICSSSPSFSIFTTSYTCHG
jgi:hypothetical protein